MSLESEVKAFAVKSLGYQVGSGECADLANKALRAAGAKITSDYGVTGSDADYKWGKLVNLRSVQAGYVLQFRNYLCTDKTVTKTTVIQPSGAQSTSSKSDTVKSKAGHHTSIVEKVSSTLSLGVLEQNWYDGNKNQKWVRRKTLYIMSFATFVSNSTVSKGVKTIVSTTRTVDVSGSIWVYKPVAR